MPKNRSCVAECCGELCVRVFAFIYLGIWGGALVLTIFGATDIANGQRVVGVAMLAAAAALVFLGISPCLLYCGWEPHKAPCSTDVDPRDGRAAHCCLFRRATVALKLKRTPGIIAIFLGLAGAGMLFLLKEAAASGPVPKKGAYAVLAFSVPAIILAATLTRSCVPWYRCWFTCGGIWPDNVLPGGWAHRGCCDPATPAPHSAPPGITGAPKDGPLAEGESQTRNPLRAAAGAGAGSPFSSGPGLAGSNASPHAAGGSSGGAAIEMLHVPTMQPQPHSQMGGPPSGVPPPASASAAWYPQPQPGGHAASGSYPYQHPSAQPQQYPQVQAYPQAQAYPGAAPAGMPAPMAAAYPGPGAYAHGTHPQAGHASPYGQPQPRGMLHAL